MSSAPRVSVIIANRNYGRFVGEAIRSALDQDYADIEVIVVDDGSSDDSRAIIDGFGDRIRRLYRTWQGQTASLNAGFVESTGEYVVFLDADDTLCTDAVSLLTAPLRADPTATKAQGYMAVIDSQGRVTGERIPRRLSPSGLYREATLKRGLGACRHAWTSGNAWARWFLEEMLPLPEFRDMGTDAFLNPAATLFGPIISIPRTVVNYRIHGENRGPKSDRFSADSLQDIVRRVRRSQDYLAACAERLGYRVDLDYWNKCNANWRRFVAEHALHLLDTSAPLPPYFDMVVSPFRSAHVSLPKAGFVSILLAVMAVSPRSPALYIARHLLGLPDDSEGDSVLDDSDSEAARLE